LLLFGFSSLEAVLTFCTLFVFGFSSLEAVPWTAMLSKVSDVGTLHRSPYIV
jgi:hypothetical protein